MAQRRMFSKDIVRTDNFLDMPLSAQALYYHLGIDADDDGFVSSAKQITRMVGAREDDLKILISKGYIIPFDSGVCVVTHWKMNNYIRPDRYKRTIYQAEIKQLNSADNGAYSLAGQSWYTAGIPSAGQLVPKRDTQESIGKDSIAKISLGEGKGEEEPEGETDQETPRYPCVEGSPPRYDTPEYEVYTERVRAKARGMLEQKPT